MRASAALRTLFITLILSLLATSAFAQSTEKTGPRAKLELAFRYQPIGISLFNNIGYRFKLSDSDSLLKKNTYIEMGSWTILSPAYIRPGVYIEAVPLSVLKLRVSAQYAQYFGTFGFLFFPEDENNPSWEIDDFSEAADASEGQAEGVIIVQSTVTPRIKVGKVVALADFQHVMMRASVNQLYYEPYYDVILEPADNIIHIRPLLGYLPHVGEDSYVLTALRYERMFTQKSDIDSHQLAAIVNWGMPRKWTPRSKMSLLALGGYWLSHPTARPSAYLAIKYTAEWGAP